MVSLTNNDMNATLATLSRTTNYTQGYDYDKANGGWKLVRADGSIEVSIRMSRRAMYDWMWAYIYGIQAGRKIFISGLRSYEVLPEKSGLLGD